MQAQLATCLTHTHTESKQNLNDEYRLPKSHSLTHTLHTFAADGPRLSLFTNKPQIYEPFTIFHSIFFFHQLNKLEQKKN